MINVFLDKNPNLVVNLDNNNAYLKIGFIMQDFVYLQNIKKLIIKLQSYKKKMKKKLSNKFWNHQKILKTL